jgi:hypothetical protein
MKPVAYHCEADVELVAAARNYQCQREDLGRKFLHAVHLVLAEIQKEPRRFRFFDRPARSRQVPGFPYRLVFEELDDCIHIVAVMLMRREPRYWKKRLD